MLGALKLYSRCKSVTNWTKLDFVACQVRVVCSWLLVFFQTSWSERRTFVSATNQCRGPWRSEHHRAILKSTLCAQVIVRTNRCDFKNSESTSDPFISWGRRAFCSLVLARGQPPQSQLTFYTRNVSMHALFYWGGHYNSLVPFCGIFGVFAYNYSCCCSCCLGWGDTGQESDIQSTSSCSLWTS